MFLDKYIPVKSPSLSTPLPPKVSFPPPPNLKFTLSRILSIQYSIVSHRPCVVQKISRNYLLCITETLYALISTSPYAPHQAPATTTLCLCVQLFQIPPVPEIIQCLSFCVGFISLSIISSRSTHVVACGRFPCFFKLNNIPVYGYNRFS